MTTNKLKVTKFVYFGYNDYYINFKLKCPYCSRFNDFPISSGQTKLFFDFEMKCSNCGNQFLTDYKKIKKEVIKEIKKYKMKREKQEIENVYLKADDVGEIGDKQKIRIVSEGNEEDSKFGGKRFVIDVLFLEVEKKFSLSATNENTLIDLFGSESQGWVNQEVSILVESCNVGKGKQITILKK